MVMKTIDWSSQKWEKNAETGMGVLLRVSITSNSDFFVGKTIFALNFFKMTKLQRTSNNYYNSKTKAY